MHYVKIGFLIVIVSILLHYDDIDQHCGFAANAFSITNILETTPGRKQNFFAKLIKS